MKREKSISGMEWAAWGWLAIFLLLAAMKNGIFQGLGLHSSNIIIAYEPPILYTFFIGIGVLIWSSTHVFQAQFKLERRMIYALASIALCLVYIMSSFNAKSPFLGHIGVLISLMVVIFFIAGTFIIQYDRIVNHFPKLYLLFGYSIVLYGFLNLLGNTYLLDSLSFIDGIRITSIFQYANAYAVLLLTLWITILTELNRTTNMWARIIHGLMLVPVCVSFLLTLSRGALIVLPIIAIVTLLMFKFKQQVLMILYSVLGMGLSLLIYTHLEQAGTKVYQGIQEARSVGVRYDTSSIFSIPSIGSWGYLAALSIIMAVLVLLIVKYIEPRLTTKQGKGSTSWMDKIVPLGLVAVFVIGAIAVTSDLITQLLPEVIRTRVENVNFQTHSVYERFTMYKDAIEIWKENPIIGGGAGVWDAVYEQHQSYSYLSAQTHGYLAQLLIEVGLVGILIYLGFIFVIIYAYIRHYRKAEEAERNKLIFYFIVPVSILLHSMIDFEMSYLLYLLLVFFCLGVMAGTQRQPVGDAESKQAVTATRWSTFVVVVGLGLFIAIQGGKQLNAVNAHKQANDEIANQTPFNQIVQTLEKGLAKSPKHPALLQQLALLHYQVYNQTQDKSFLETANQYIDKLYKYEPYNREAVELHYAIKLAIGNRDEAIRILVNATHQYPFDLSLYDQAVSELVTDWEVSSALGLPKAEITANQILSLYEEMKSREQIINELPESVNPNNIFAVSDTVRLAASKVMNAQSNSSAE